MPFISEFSLLLMTWDGGHVIDFANKQHLL